MDVILQTEHLSKSYGAHRALSDLELTVERGEIYGFLGPNGAGKSTTIRILLGLLRATAGSARVSGFDCWSQSRQVRRRVGYLPGDVRFPEGLRGRELVRQLARLRGVEGDGGDLADRFELDLDRRIRAYSKGMRQKLGIVVAFFHAPEFLILDEPTSGLDPIHQRRLLDLIAERRQQGATVFFSSHVLSEVEGTCDRVAMLRAGRLIRCGPLHEVEELRRRRFTLHLGSEQEAASVAERLAPFAEPVQRSGCTVVADCQDTEAAIESLRGVDRSSLRIEAPRLEDVFHSLYLAQGGVEEPNGEPDSEPRSPARRGAEP